MPVSGARPRARLAGALAVVALGAAACTSAGPQAVPDTLMAGQIPKALVPHVTTGKLKGASVGDTVPLAKQNPTTALFSAIGIFQSCLQGLGVTFIGAPNPSDPNSPANNPGYVKNLVTCAAKSNILNALKGAQSAQNNLTLAQIQKENKDYLKFRKCMIARGWKIPLPKPNAKGLLFSFGGTGGSGPQMTPPPGQSLINSPDLQACASQASNGAV